MARGRKRKNVSSSEEEEEDESSLTSSEEEEELDDDDESDEDDRPKKRKPAAKKGRGGKAKAAPAAKKKAAAPRGKKAKQVVEQEEEEELLGGDGPSSTAAGAAAGGAGAGAAGGEDENDPGYGDDLIIDEKDKLFLNSLSEMDREQVLSDRYEKLMRYKEWKALRASTAAASSTAGAKGRKKTTAQAQVKAVTIESDEEEDDEERKRKQTGAAGASARKPSAMAAAAAAQQQPQDESEQEEESEEDEDSREMYWFEKEPGDAEADEDAPPPDLNPVTYKAVLKIYLTRHQILQWIDYPRFRSGLIGCLVKMRVDSDDGQEHYALRQIVKVEVKDVQPYVVDKEPVMFLLKTRGGPKNRASADSLAKVSNKPLTQEEFEAYREMPPLVRSTTAPVERMTNYQAELIEKHLRTNLSQFVITGDHVLQMVEAKKYRRGDHSVLSRSLGLSLVGKKKALMQEIAECNRQRTRLAHRLEMASAQGGAALNKKNDESSSEEEDEDKDGEGEQGRQARIRRILGELKEVNEKLNQLEQEQEKVEAQIAKDSDKRLAREVSYKLNERNQQRNRDTLMRVEQQKRIASAVQEESAAGGASLPLNPFLRRPTRPVMMWATEQKEAANDSNNNPNNGNTTGGTTASATDSKKKDGDEQARNDEKKKALKEAGTLNNNSLVEELKDAAGDIRPAQQRLKIASDAPIAKSTATKKFSLEEYRRMKQQGR